MVGGTIAAIATALGESALAIVRVSGPEALAIASRVYRGRVVLSDAPPNTAWFGTVRDRNGADIDQVVATVFRAPSSSTGEDVVEFTCHGGEVAPRVVLRALYEAGATPAEAGEFTRRAFVNGKVGLDQAEAVIDLIHAKSEAAQRAAVRQLQGRLRDQLSVLRDQLLELAGLVELELDFSDEDVEFADKSRLAALLDQVSRTTGALLESAGHTDQIRDGVKVVLAGRPNSGKSTLLNALVGQDRVIVSAQPGTTRDFVEVEYSLDGLLLRLVDTAGLRKAEDSVEQEGVRRSERLVNECDVLIYVYDATTGLTAEEESYLASLDRAAGEESVVVVANKVDLVPAYAVVDSGNQDHGGSDSRDDEVDGSHPGSHAGSHAGTRAGTRAADLRLAALHAQADPTLLSELQARILAALPKAIREHESSPGMINARHRRHLLVASEAVIRAQDAMQASLGGELLSIELRSALDALGAITGEITSEDVLSEVFGRFCIGK